MPALGQDAPARRGLSIVPHVAVTETLSDNARLKSVNKESDLITQASAGVSAKVDSARAKGFLDYALTASASARGSRKETFMNALNAFATLAVVEERAFIDVAGNISQQVTSAFGTQSPDPALNNDNQTEVSSFMVSPYVRGNLGKAAVVEARLRYADTRSDTSGNTGNTSSSALLRASNGKQQARLGWSAVLSHDTIEFRNGRQTEIDRFRGDLTWAFSRQFAVSAIAGVESNDFASAEKRSHELWGLRANWQPQERTRLLAEYERRFFGNAHTVSFTHRTPRTAWIFNDSRDVSTNNNLPVVRSVGTVYDLFFLQFASIQPDPVLRGQLVDTFLRAYGVNPNEQVLVGFLTSAVTVQSRQEFSFSWLGVRDTVTFSAARSGTRRLDALSAANDDFSTSTVVRQSGLALRVSHRLTPLSSANLLLSAQRTTGSLASQTSRLRLISLLWTSRLGLRSDLSVGARHAVFDSASSPYDESALFATYKLRF